MYFKFITSYLNTEYLNSEKKKWYVEIDKKKHVVHFDSKKGVIRVHQPTTDGDQVYDIEFYQDCIIPKLKNEVENVLQNIEKEIIELTKNSKKIEGFVSQVVNDILYHQKKASNFSSELGFVNLELEKASNYLIDKYLTSVKSQNVSRNTLFGVTSGVNKKLISSLYDLVDQHQIIDYEQVSESTFHNVLFGMPNTEEYILFNCNNQKAAVFLESIKPLFIHFESKTIGDSEKFFKKSKEALKLFKTGDIDTAKYRARTNPDPTYKIIKKEIQSIIDLNV